MKRCRSYSRRFKPSLDTIHEEYTVQAQERWRNLAAQATLKDEKDTDEYWQHVDRTYERLVAKPTGSRVREATAQEYHQHLVKSLKTYKTISTRYEAHTMAYDAQISNLQSLYGALQAVSVATGAVPIHDIGRMLCSIRTPILLRPTIRLTALPPHDNLDENKQWLKNVTEMSVALYEQLPSVKEALDTVSLCLITVRQRLETITDFADLHD